MKPEHRAVLKIVEKCQNGGCHIRVTHRELKDQFWDFTIKCLKCNKTVYTQERESEENAKPSASTYVHGSIH